MSRRMRAVAVETWLPLTLLTAWWVASAGSASLYFPPLSEILVRFRELWLFSQVETHIVPSLINLAAGLFLGLAVALGLGLVLGRAPRVSDALTPLLELARATPVLALLPLLIAFLGISSTSKIVLIAFGSFWPTLLNTIDGVRAVDPQVREMTRTFSLTRRTIIRRVVLPSAAPQIIVGVRTSLSIAVVVMVGSELFGATAGIGYFVLQSQRTFAISDMWAGLLMLGLLGYALNSLMGAVEHRALSWHRGLRQAAAGTAPTKERST